MCAYIILRLGVGYTYQCSWSPGLCSGIPPARPGWLASIQSLSFCKLKYLCPIPVPNTGVVGYHRQPKMTQTHEAAANGSLEQSHVYLRSWRLAVVITSLCFGILLLGLDMNIIGVAIPRITTDFHSLNDIAWYGSAYLLTITAFQPLFGNLYKFFNAKAVYIASLLIFEGTRVHSNKTRARQLLMLKRSWLRYLRCVSILGHFNLRPSLSWVRGRRAAAGCLGHYRTFR